MRLSRRIDSLSHSSCLEQCISIFVSVRSFTPLLSRVLLLASMPTHGGNDDVASSPHLDGERRTDSLLDDLWDIVESYDDTRVSTIHERGCFRRNGQYLYPPHSGHQSKMSKEEAVYCMVYMVLKYRKEEVTIFHSSRYAAARWLERFRRFCIAEGWEYPPTNPSLRFEEKA